MDASTNLVKARPPLIAKKYKDFLITVEDKGTFALEINRFTDKEYYFGIHKYWKKDCTEELHHGHTINLPIVLWKNFLNVLTPASLAIGMYTIFFIA